MGFNGLQWNFTVVPAKIPDVSVIASGDAKFNHPISFLQPMVDAILTCNYSSSTLQSTQADGPGNPVGPCCCTMPLHDFLLRLLGIARTIQGWHGQLLTLDRGRRDKLAAYANEIAATFARAALAFTALDRMPYDQTAMSTAADLQAELITPDVLEQGLRAAAPTLRQQAALNVQEERVRALLTQRGSLSDETITIEDLEQLGLRSFSDILPFLERLEEADLAHQLNQEDAKAYAPIPLPPSDDEFLSLGGS